MPATTARPTIELADQRDDDQIVLLTIVDGEAITHQPTYLRTLGEFVATSYGDALQLAYSQRVSEYVRPDGSTYRASHADAPHWVPGTKCAKVESYAIVVDRSALEHYVS